MNSFFIRLCRSAILRRAAIILAAIALVSFASSCSSGPKPGISQAAHDGDVEKVKALLQSNRSLALDTDNYDTTPLHWAANKEVAELLLANGADVNARNKYGDTPLHFAASSGHKDVVEVLLDRGAEVNVVDGPPISETPMHGAESAGYKDIVELLRQHGGHE